jgi:hypothetical protein
LQYFPKSFSDCTPAVLSVVNSALIPSPTDLYEVAVELIESGITPGNLTQLIGVITSGCNSQRNQNPAPSKPIYPKKSPSDAPYSVSESQLRAAIHIPTTFTYGKKTPVILVPGTGETGCTSYIGNYIKLLTGTSYADPVWLNVPDYMLDDAQVNAVILLSMSKSHQLIYLGICGICH